MRSASAGNLDFRQVPTILLRVINYTTVMQMMVTQESAYFQALAEEMCDTTLPGDGSGSVCHFSYTSLTYLSHSFCFSFV